MAENEEKRRHTDPDLHALALSLERLSTIVELGEKSRATDMQNLRDKIGEKNEDFRVLRHDVQNIAQALQALPLMTDGLRKASEMLAEHAPRIKAIESFVDKHNDSIVSIPSIEKRVDELEKKDLTSTTERRAYSKVASGVWILLGALLGAVPLILQLMGALRPAAVVLE